MELLCVIKWLHSVQITNVQGHATAFHNMTYFDNMWIKYLVFSDNGVFFFPFSQQRCLVSLNIDAPYISDAFSTSRNALNLPARSYCTAWLERWKKFAFRWKPICFPLKQLWSKWNMYAFLLFGACVMTPRGVLPG